MADPGRVSTRQEFADALTALREHAGLTVRDVARKVDVPSATIGGYFAGRHLPPLKPPDQLARILSACGVDNAIEIDKWVAALSRIRRAPGRRPADAPVPYLGLKTFQPEDAEWFYGRRRLTDVLLENLRDCYQRGGLLAVVGPSGAGKSSLLRAGLIPALRSGALDVPGSGDWPLILMTPGAQPAQDLGEQLTAVVGDTRDQHVVIVVDQFEEVFTSCPDESERLAFIRALSAADGSGRLATAEEWAAQPAHGDDLNVLEREFIDASVRQRVAAERSSRRQTRRLRVFVGALAALFLVAGTLAVVAYQQKNTATSQRDVAISRQLATDADQLRTTDIALAMQLALAAYRVSPTAEATSSLLDSTAAPPTTRMIGPAGTEMLSLALSRGGALLATGADNGTVRLWSLARPGHPLLLAAPPPMPGPVSALAFSPDGSLLAISAGGTVSLWNVGDPRRPVLAGRIPAVPGAAMDTVAYSPDGQTLATADASGRVYLWDTADPRHVSPRGAPLEAGTGQVNAFAFSPDAEILAAGGANGHLRLWSLTKGDAHPAALAFLAGPANGINAIAFSPDSRTIAAGGNDSRVWLWTLADGGRTISARAPLTGARSWIYSVAFSPTGNAVAAGSADDNAYVWSLPGGVLTTTLPHPVPVTVVAYGADGDMLVTGDADDVAQLWTLPGPVLAAPAGSSVFTVAFSPDSDVLVAGSAPPNGDGAVQLWNPGSHDQPAPFGPPLTTPTGLDGTVAYGPDGRLAAGGDKGGVLIWNVRDPRHPVELPTPTTPLNSAIQYVAFDKTGRLMAAGSTDGTVTLWNTGRSRENDADRGVPGRHHRPGLLPRRFRGLLTVLSGPAGIVYDVAFSPDGQTLATADGDKTIALWNIANPARPAKIGSLTGPVGTVFSVAFSSDGTTLAAGSQDDTTRLWMATPTSAAAYVCAVTGDPMTRAEWAQYMPELAYSPPCEDG